MGREEISSRTRTLVDVAMGRKAADLVICNGRWVNVHSGEILPGTDVAVSGSRIAYVGADAGHTIGPGTKVIEAHGRYLVPGLCDAHMHVESGMVTVTEFARAVGLCYRWMRSCVVDRPVRTDPATAFLSARKTVVRIGGSGRWQSRISQTRSRAIA